MKKCLNCGKELTARMGKLPIKKYCSSKCQSMYLKKIIKEKMGFKGVRYNFNVPPEIRGSISELKVCIDLFEREYEIFRPLNPHCSFDMVVHKKETGKMNRVEVKTIHNENFKLTHKNFNNLNCDILAVVIFNKILYFNYETNEKIKL